MSLCAEDVYGVEPVSIKWNVVRGDTATLRIDFFEEDEENRIDISGWRVESTVFNPQNNEFIELDVTVNDGWIVVTAEENVTALWGSGMSQRVNELSFDIEVILEDNSTWTPVRGFVSVISDVTGGTL